ncbi:MAG: HEAT repeat domain-containing protein [Chloroflexi bacterium]|nr:HEAT repeat domain-containing protein [Chloroflexota bacterium]
MIQSRYLEELQDPERALSAAKLLNLSGLDQQELDQLRASWDLIEPGRRQELISRMAEIAEDDPSVDFSAVYRLGLTDEDEAVRLEALDGLWECQDRWLIDELLVMMDSDDSIEVRSAAASNLGKFALLGELQELAPHDSARVR